METLNQDRFLELYTPIHISLSRFCRVISGNREDAEDLMNDTVVVAIENLPKLKNELAFKSFVFSIAVNLNKMRKRSKKTSIEFVESDFAHIIDFNSNPEYIADFQIVYKQILALSPKMAEALILFHVSDISLEEIQKIQGGSLSGVKLRLKRGREQLLENLNTRNQKAIVMMLFTL